MKIGSLFSGIGGLDLGLERSGHTIVWHSEMDKSASAILARHWPHLENLGDVTEVDWSTVERPDAICSGNPCPDFSQAGQRKGMAGEHGQLWFEVTRAIRALRPKTIILENVPGIYSAPGLALDSGESALGVVLSDLASLGYVGSYASIRASDFGACHRRERWFAIAHAAGERGWEESGGASQHEAEQNGSASSTNYVFGSAGQGRLQAAVIADARSKRRYGGGGRDESQAATGRQNGGSSAKGHCVSSTDWGLYLPAITRWEEIFGRPAPRPADAGRLRPEFVEWMMGFDDGWTEGVARMNRLRCLGNAVFIPIAEYLGSMIDV